MRAASVGPLSSSGVSICTFVLVKQGSGVQCALLLWPPLRSSGVKICTFVLVTQVKGMRRREKDRDSSESQSV
jgi:hypothetical protein